MDKDTLIRNVQTKLEVAQATRRELESKRARSDIFSAVFSVCIAIMGGIAYLLGDIGMANTSALAGIFGFVFAACLITTINTYITAGRRLRLIKLEIDTLCLSLEILRVVNDGTNTNTNDNDPQTV